MITGRFQAFRERTEDEGVTPASSPTKHLKELKKGLFPIGSMYGIFTYIWSMFMYGIFTYIWSMFMYGIFTYIWSMFMVNVRR